MICELPLDWGGGWMKPFQCCDMCDAAIQNARSHVTDDEYMYTIPSWHWRNCRSQHVNVVARLTRALHAPPLGSASTNRDRAPQIASLRTSHPKVTSITHRPFTAPISRQHVNIPHDFRLRLLRPRPPPKYIYELSGCPVLQHLRFPSADSSSKSRRTTMEADAACDAHACKAATTAQPASLESQ